MASYEFCETREEEVRSAFPRRRLAWLWHLINLSSTLSVERSLDHALFRYHCLHRHVMPSWFKIGLLSFKSQSDQVTALEALAIKGFVIVAAPHPNSIAAIIEPDDRYAHNFYVNSSNAASWLNDRFLDAKTILPKGGFTRRIWRKHHGFSLTHFCPNDGKVNELVEELCKFYYRGCVDLFRKREIYSKLFTAPKRQVSGEFLCN